MTQRQLKRVALITMIIDHIGSFLPGMPVWFRCIGRISAPLFIFCCVQSFHNTSSKQKFLLRLYISSMIMTVGNFIINSLAANSYQDVLHNNFFLTLFIGALIVYMYDKWKIRGIIIFVFYQFLLYLFAGYGSIWFKGIMYFVADYFAPQIGGLIFAAEGGITYILLFVLMYYVKDRIRLLSGLMVCCSLFLYVFSKRVNSPFLSDLLALSPIQHLLIFSLPFFFLYNGKKGRGSKYFYYIFYPIHIWLLFIVGRLMM